MAQRTHAEWLDDLQCIGERRSQALADLRAIILDGLPHAIGGKIPPDSPDYKTLADKVAQKTLIRVHEHLGDYNGKSAFTTWVHKHAVRQALLELRLQQWQVVSSEQALPNLLLACTINWRKINPCTVSTRLCMTNSPRTQRLAIRSMVMLRMPKEEVARYLGMELCDYFRMIHDARLRMKRRLRADGWLPIDETIAK